MSDQEPNTEPEAEAPQGGGLSSTALLAIELEQEIKQAAKLIGDQANLDRLLPCLIVNSLRRLTQRELREMCRNIADRCGLEVYDPKEPPLNPS